MIGTIVGFAMTELDLIWNMESLSIVAGRGALVEMDGIWN